MADQTLHTMTENTSPAIADELYLLDDPAGTPANNRITIANLLKIINALTADSTPDLTADYVVTYDASAAAAKKVLLQNVGGYTLNFSTTEDFNPADSTTYYFGALKGPTTSATTRRLFIPRAGVIRAVYMYAAFTNGSNEANTFAIRLNDATDTTISSSIAFNSSPATISNTALSITVSAGHAIEIKWTTPAWATNPTAMAFSGAIWIA